MYQIDTCPERGSAEAAGHRRGSSCIRSCSAGLDRLRLRTRRRSPPPCARQTPGRPPARSSSSPDAASEGAAHQEEDRAGRDHLRMPSPSELRPRVRQADGRAVLASASSTPDRSAHCRGPSVNRSQLGSTVVNLVHPASTEGASARIRRSGLQVREASCGRRCATSGGHRRLRGEGARPCRWSVAAAPRGCPADAAQGRWRRR